MWCNSLPQSLSNAVHTCTAYYCSTSQSLVNNYDCRAIRTERILELKKIPYEFEKIALGLGDYDTDSDFSVMKKR